MSTLDNYTDWTRSTAIYPDVGTGSIRALSYVGLGLAGEAGEVADKIKKLLRDGDTETLREKILDEAGDVLWYLARLAEELGTDLEGLAGRNVSKLESRKARNVLGGSGDSR